MQLMFLSIALFSSSLLAQQASPATGQGVHLGTSNEYKIGTSDSPVLAPEYKDFLNDESPSDRPWVKSSYYDGLFMTSNNWGWQNNSNAAIYRTGTSGNYLYSVISDHENDIIDAVSSQSIQQKFNAWRAEKEAAIKAAIEAAEKAAAAAEIGKNNPPPVHENPPAPEISDTSATETIVTQN